MGTSTRTRSELFQTVDGKTYVKNTTRTEHSNRCCLITTLCVTGLWPCAIWIVFCSDVGTGKHEHIQRIDSANVPDLSTLKMER